MERLLHALPQLRVIDEIEDLERPADLVEFPQGFLGWVLPRVVAELAHDGGLGHVLVHQRRHDALDVGPAVTSLTSHNMAARFGSMRTVLGAREYGEILSRNEYGKVVEIRSVDKARVVYRDLLNAFRPRSGQARTALGGVEYVKILRELRLNPKARLNPDQAARVFDRMQEELRHDP